MTLAWKYLYLGVNLAIAKSPLAWKYLYLRVNLAIVNCREEIGDK